MPILAKSSSGDGDFIPAPAGTHRGVLVDVVDLGMVETTWQGQKKSAHMARLVWQIDEPMPDGKLFVVGQRYTLSLHPKSNLRKMLETWRGAAFPVEVDDFDVETMIGRSCLVTVTHNTTQKGTFANVTGVTPLVRGMEAMRPRDYVRKVDREPSAPRQAQSAQDQSDYDDRNPPPFDDDIPF